MHDQEKSDSPIVPEILLNKSRDNKRLAEVREERGELMWNTKHDAMLWTLCQENRRSL